MSELIPKEFFSVTTPKGGLFEIPLMSELTSESLTTYLKYCGDSTMQNLEKAGVDEEKVTGGYSGEVRRGFLKFIGDEEVIHVMIKGRRHDHPVSKDDPTNVGSLREACFYSELAPKLKIATPQIYFSRYT